MTQDNVELIALGRGTVNCFCIVQCKGVSKGLARLGNYLSGREGCCRLNPPYKTW